MFYFAILIKYIITINYCYQLWPILMEKLMWSFKALNVHFIKSKKEKMQKRKEKDIMQTLWKDLYRD